MKSIVFILCVILCSVAPALSNIQTDEDLLSILNNYKIIKDKYSPDPNVKIIKINFEKKSTDQWNDTWEVETTIKSCYKINVSCNIDGYFEYTDDYYYAQRDSWGLFFGPIKKQSTDTGLKHTMVIRKEKEPFIKLFKIRMTCEPIYSDHPNKYPPNHKYWKQFAPGKCD